MPFTDRTSDLRVLAGTVVPIDHNTRKRRKIPGDNASEHSTAALSRQYIAEGYVVLNTIHALNRMLSAIRRPYLNVDTRSIPLRHPEAQFLALDADPSTWAQVKHLSNEERDQIDLQARITLSRCSDKVKEMEAFERKRAELVESKENALLRFIPSRLRQDQQSLAAKAVAAHHASITWYLSRRLTEASQAQKEMQEERIKRQSESTTTLGSTAGRETAFLQHVPQGQVTSSPSWLGQASSGFIASALGAPSPSYSSSSTVSPSYPMPPDNDDDESDDEIELTESQIQQFEQENAEMLQMVEDNLGAVQQAESRLMDISALQMELVTHLTQQTELAEQLYEDAIATTSLVEKGNEQLSEAARRGKDSRLFLLVFLIGASLSLLFLHYY